MNDARSLGEQFSDSANEFWTTVGDYLPKLLGALVLIILALIVAKIAEAIVVKVLHLIGVSKLAKNERVAKTLKSAEVNVDFVGIAGRIVFWIVIIIFAMTIADVLDLTAMRDVIRELLAYLPNVLAGAIVLTVTIGGARLVRDVVGASLTRMRVDFAHTVASVVFYVLLVFGLIMTIDQLGFNTTILTANLTVIVAGFVLALALAFGLGGREVAGRILDEAYKNHKNLGGKRR